jgi:hypothetical protein
MDTCWNSLKKVISDDSLSIMLFSLFLVSLIGQGVTGWLAYNHSLKARHFREIPLGSYLDTGNFLDGIFSNWQAAILQLAVLISFSSVLRQKGAAHSRKMAPTSHRKIDWKLGLRPTVQEWLYANSLSLAFLGIFVVTFLLHALFGEWKYNENQALRHLPAISFGSYAGSSSFWFSVFQCWEAEFWAIGLYIVLSIFLRQENSPESKPVGASDEQTGGVNE